jgi:hypothetical protein
MSLHYTAILACLGTIATGLSLFVKPLHRPTLHQNGIHSSGEFSRARTVPELVAVTALTGIEDVTSTESRAGFDPRKRKAEGEPKPRHSGRVPVLMNRRNSSSQIRSARGNILIQRPAAGGPRDVASRGTVIERDMVGNRGNARRKETMVGGCPRNPAIVSGA